MVMPNLKDECLHDFNRSQVRYHGWVIDEQDTCTKCGYEKIIVNKPVSFMNEIDRHVRNCY
jgi:hypothetical protein